MSNNSHESGQKHDNVLEPGLKSLSTPTCTHPHMHTLQRYTCTHILTHTLTSSHTHIDLGRSWVSCKTRVVYNNHPLSVGKGREWRWVWMCGGWRWEEKHRSCEEDVERCRKFERGRGKGRYVCGCVKGVGLWRVVMWSKTTAPRLPDKCSSLVEVHSMFDLLFETAAEQSQQFTHREIVFVLRANLWK